MNALLEHQSDGNLLHSELVWLVAILEWAAAIINFAAVALILVGAARFILGVVVAEIARRGAERVEATNRNRIELGRYILASLELFIVSDIVHAALSLAFADLLFLGLLVLIRSVISYFLERELDQLKKELAS